MPLETQAVLLRVLDNKQVMRVGGNKYYSVDFRLIAATNQNIKLMAESERFRSDLYYRLSVLTVNIPPLRERQGDIIILAKMFIRKHTNFIVKKIPEISPEAMTKLVNYSWPGNVRQLENAIIYSLNVLDSDIIQSRHLPEELTKDLANNQEIDIRRNIEKTEIISSIRERTLQLNAVITRIIITLLPKHSVYTETYF